MEFSDVVKGRRTVREFTGDEVLFASIERIIGAGMQAPSWDHYRGWQFIVLHDRAEKERAFAYARGVVRKFDEKRCAGRELDLSQWMYVYAMPRQYTMLVECPYVVVPLFRCTRLNAEYVSKLNPLATAWCVVENMLLAAVNEGLGCSLRIPLNKEHDVVLEALHVPDGWITPCFIGIGHPRPDEELPKQYAMATEGHLHFGMWGGSPRASLFDLGR